MVHISGLRRSVGRPSHLYVLTSEAEARFPKGYDRLALEVLDYMCEVGGNHVVEQVLARRRAGLIDDLAPALVGKSHGEQVAVLATLLGNQGYMCEWEQETDGSFVLTEYNCPIDCVARRHVQLCAQEQQLYEELLGGSVIQECTISQGSHCCRYRISA
jgi:predicted ArsR family transcriptional regulator